MSGKIQNEDLKSEAELVSAGATVSSLWHDDKVYVTANGINKTLDQAIIDSDIGGGGGGTLTRTTLTGSGTFVVPAGVTTVKVYAKIHSRKLISGANSFGVAIKNDGSAWAWGYNTDGNLGDNTTAGKSSPVAVVGGHSFIGISSADGSTVSLKADGSAWCWGLNNFGQLGDNTTTSKSSPVAVVGDHKFVRIAGKGTDAFIGLKEDGSAWMWGSNVTGELGNNTLTNSSSPTAVAGGHQFIDVECTFPSMGLKADGSAWTWGYNASGQLGDNTNTDSSSPVQVVGGHQFIKISLGAGLKADGSVWCWGSNGVGQLGDNTITSKSSPVAVVGGHKFIKVSKSVNFAAALKADGSVWTWGSNGAGQLGDNTTTDRSSPIAVIGGHQFVDIFVPSIAMCMGLKSDGSLWTWGANSSGNLGDNTLTNKSSPVQVVGQYFAPLSSENNVNELKKFVLTVTPGQSIDYGTGILGFFGSNQLGSFIESIMVEYSA